MAETPFYPGTGDDPGAGQGEESTAGSRAG
jgi:hypothetical protein